MTNAPTRAMLAIKPSCRPYAMRQLFLDGYAAYASWCRDIDEPGLAVFAVDERTSTPSGCVRLRVGIEHRAAIVGRHERCDLVLREHERLALRQLAIILDPVRSWRRGAGVRYRVLDLRTATGFTDETRREVRGLCAEGPALLRCAGSALFVMPLGDPTDWPERAADAWSILPERVYFDELESEPAPDRPGALDRGMLLRTLGVRDASMMLVDGTDDIAHGIELVMTAGSLAIGSRALRDGVLLGRYPRCDGSPLLMHPSISRVHMLVIEIDDVLLAIDTASTYGTRRAGLPKARTIVLDGDTELVLGNATNVRWRWFA